MPHVGSVIHSRASPRSLRTFRSIRGWEASRFPDSPLPPLRLATPQAVDAQPIHFAVYAVIRGVNVVFGVDFVSVHTKFLLVTGSRLSIKSVPQELCVYGVPLPSSREHLALLPVVPEVAAQTTIPPRVVRSVTLPLCHNFATRGFGCGVVMRSSNGFYVSCVHEATSPIASGVE
jgi:hypothetical protein